MICDLCRKLLFAERVAPPHRALVQAGRTTKLRPTLRRPVHVARYRCGECSTNWILDDDPSNANNGGWTWLGCATSVLQPPASQICQP